VLECAGATLLQVDVRNPYALGPFGVEIVPFYGFEHNDKEKEYDGWDICVIGESRDIQTKRYKAELHGERFVLIKKPRSPRARQAKVNYMQYENQEKINCVKKGHAAARGDYSVLADEEKEIRLLLEFPHVPVQMGRETATKLSNEFFQKGDFAGDPKKDLYMDSIPTVNKSTMKDDQGKPVLEVITVISWKVVNLKSERSHGERISKSKISMPTVNMSNLNLDDDDGE
jgi:hypothetical protein